MTAEYIDDIAWFIQCAAAAQGERGTTGQMIDLLRFGVPSRGGVPNTDLYSDRQLGWGRWKKGEVERARGCVAVWRRLEEHTRRILIARYDSRQWAPGIAGQLGDLAGVVIVIVGTRNSKERIRHAQTAIRLVKEECTWNAELSELESSAQDGVIPSDWEPVARACQVTCAESKRLRERWVKEAEAAVKAAHAEWRSVSQLLAQEWVG